MEGEIEALGEILGLPEGEIEADGLTLGLRLGEMDGDSEGDIEGLKEVSPRFREMIDAYKEIPHQELVTLTVAELLKRISENLSDEFRRQYYQQSPKLRNYVQSSKDDNLLELYPFKKETITP